MMVWWVVNLDTGETRRVRALDASGAARAAGWRSDCCDARIVPPRRLG